MNRRYNLALAEALCKPYKSPNPYKQVQADIDLITCSGYLISSMPAAISLCYCWVKGHYQGPNRALEHDLNNIADRLADRYNSSPHSAQAKLPILHPTSTIEVLHDNQIITLRLLKWAFQLRHTPSLGKTNLTSNWMDDHCLQ